MRLQSALGELIAEVAYDDVSPWSEEADGGGFSLVYLEDPALDASAPGSWRVSVFSGGSAGSVDTMTFTEWITFQRPAGPVTDREPGADPDQDGVANVVEYAFGLSPNVSDADLMPGLENKEGIYSISFVRALYQTDLVIKLETSEDAQLWVED